MDPIAHCTPKDLPDDLLLLGAELAIAQNPANDLDPRGKARAAGRLEPGRLAAMVGSLWKKGTIITVGSLEPAPAGFLERLVDHGNAWSAEGGDISFVVSKIDPMVRLTRELPGYWSYIGTDVLAIPRGEPTLCLQGFSTATAEELWRQVARHELGHTLGYAHEHLRRQFVQDMIEEAVIAWARQEYGWPESLTRQNILVPLEDRSIMGSPRAQATSVMAYRLPGFLFRSKVGVEGGTDITREDRGWHRNVYGEPDVVVVPPEPPKPPPGGEDPDRGEIEIGGPKARAEVGPRSPARFGFRVERAGKLHLEVEIRGGLARVMVPGGLVKVSLRREGGGTGRRITLRGGAADVGLKPGKFELEVGYPLRRTVAVRLEEAE